MGAGEQVVARTSDVEQVWAVATTEVDARGEARQSVVGGLVLDEAIDLAQEMRRRYAQDGWVEDGRGGYVNPLGWQVYIVVLG